MELEEINMHLEISITVTNIPMYTIFRKAHNRCPFSLIKLYASTQRGVAGVSYNV